MGKLIYFPQKIAKPKYTYKDYINIVIKIHDLKQNIELEEQYNEYYKEYKSEEEYLKCIEDIEFMKVQLKGLKKKRLNIEQKII